MSRLWHLMLLLRAWSPLRLSSSARLIGTPRECEAAHFVPGYNLGGEGFDIVTMERKVARVIDTETWKLGSNGTCRLYRNSYMNGEKQKVPVSVVDWGSLPMCSSMVSSTLYDSVEALVKDSTSSVSADWKVGLDIPFDAAATVGVSFGGSHSKESVFGMKKSKQDRYTFTRHSIHCDVYRYRLATEPPLSHDFESAMNSLPSYSHETELIYRSLIDIYGTHYITQVSLGGEIKAVTSIKTCEATMSGLSTTEVSDCLSVEAQAGVASSASIRSYQHCQGKKTMLGINQRFSSMFNERNTEVIGGNINSADILFEGQSNPSVYNSWLSSLRATPDVVQYNLKPLHTILPAGHPAAAGLKQEVEKYIKSNAVLSKCSESCEIGLRSSNRDSCACVCNSNQNIKSNCCPAGKGVATLKVFGLYAERLYGDVWTDTDGSVEVTYGDQQKRTVIINNNNNPTWSETFDFGLTTINMKNKLRFSVYDEDGEWNSELLGECSFDLRKGKVTDSCMFTHGTFFFSYIVQCAPSLSGHRCQEYIPTPMSPSLAMIFHTRNGVLLRELGSPAEDSY